MKIIILAENVLIAYRLRTLTFHTDTNLGGLYQRETNYRTKKNISN